MKRLLVVMLVVNAVVCGVSLADGHWMSALVNAFAVAFNTFVLTHQRQPKPPPELMV